MDSSVTNKRSRAADTLERMTPRPATEIASRPTSRRQTGKRLHVVSNTHWDREHRHGFQETRYMLVEAIDKLLGIMRDDPEFRHFVFDGQSVMLEDYLEVRPEKRQELTELIQAGRILVGPWYTLPDMQSVNPESLVRNLLTGDRLCAQFGPKMSFGYSIFSFGQIAQLPQIYRGFDIENMIVYKGYKPDLFKQSEFRWIAPDGTEILASRLGKLFRINFLFCFTIPVILGGDARKRGWEVSFTGPTRLAHMVDGRFAGEHATELEQDIRIRDHKIKQALGDILDSVDETAAQKTFLGFDGVDFSSPLAEIPEALRRANEIAGDDLEIVHSTPPAYFAELRQELDLDKLMTYTGELRFGPMGKVHSECLSSNVELKQRNYAVENAVLNYAEPFSVFNMLSGGKSYPAGQLLLAWKYLFKSHAHDSIHGIGVPKIKRDTLFRLDQAEEIVIGAARRAFEGIIAQIDTSTCSDDDICLTAFNPTPYPRSEVVTLAIDLPRNELVESYHLETPQGRKLQAYEHDRCAKNMASINGENRPKAVTCDRADIDVLLPEVPALGYRTFKIKRTPGSVEKPAHPFFNPIFPYDPIVREGNILDNGLLRITVKANGTFDVSDLTHGRDYRDLNLFLDSGDAGDFWIHRPPCRNRILNSHAARVTIATTRNSSLSGTLEIETVLDTPESLTQDRKARSEHTIPMRLRTEITLAQGSQRLDVKVHLDNQVRDHRLAVVFPTGVQTDHVYSENAFEIRRRPVNHASNRDGIVGDDVLRQPMHGFVDVNDGGHGLALFTRGIKEFETVHDTDGKVRLALTLLRAVTQTFPIHEEVFLDFDDEASQCLGNHTFEYALYFHQGDTFGGDVIAQSRMYHAPLTAGQFGKGTGQGRLPLNGSFLTLANRNTVINCIKQGADGDAVIVRLNNPTGQPITEQLRFFHPIEKVNLTNLNEQPRQELTVHGGQRIELDLPPYRIVTLAVTPKK